MKQIAEEQKDRDGKKFEQRLSSAVRVHSVELLPSTGRKNYFATFFATHIFCDTHFSSHTVFLYALKVQWPGCGIDSPDNIALC